MASPRVTASTNDVRSIATKADQLSPSLVFARDNLRQLQTTMQWRVCAVAEDRLKKNKHRTFFNYRVDALNLVDERGCRLGQASIYCRAHADFASCGSILWRRGTPRHAFQKKQPNDLEGVTGWNETCWRSKRTRDV